MNVKNQNRFPHPFLVSFIVFLIVLMGLGLNANTQRSPFPQKEERIALIDSLFDAAERSNLNTSQVLHYDYFFSDRKKGFLEEFLVRLEQDSFEFVSLTKDKKKWRLHVMRNEVHSRESIDQLEKKFRWLKFKFLIDHYEGFEIKPADPNPLIVAEDEFIPYLHALTDKEVFYVANRLLQLKSYPRALVAFEEAMKRNIHPDTIHYNMGKALVSTHEYVEGIGLWEKAVELNPKYLDVYLSLGKIFYENSHFKKALTNFMAADKLDPDNDEILYLTGETLYQLKRYNEAYDYTKRAVRLNRHNDYAKSLLKILKRPSIKKARRVNPSV